MKKKRKWILVLPLFLIGCSHNRSEELREACLYQARDATDIQEFYFVSTLDAQGFPVSKTTVFQALTQSLGLETQIELSNLETDTIIQYLNSLGVGSWRLERGIEAFKRALFQDLPAQVPVLVKMPIQALNILSSKNQDVWALIAGMTVDLNGSIQALYLLEPSVGISKDGKRAEFIVKLEQDVECLLNYLNAANDIEVLSLIP